MIAAFALVSAASAVALIVVHTVAFGIGHRIGRYNVVDVALRGRPGFSAYQQRASFFIPRPPRLARI